MFVFLFFPPNTSSVHWTYWKSTHVRHFKALRLRVTKPGALQVLKWEKAFRPHSSTEDASPTCETSHFTSGSTGRRAGSHRARSELRHQSSSPWTSRRPSAAPTLPRSESSMRVCYDPRLRWGMPPVFWRHTPARQEESDPPIWIMCLTNINMWKK